MSAFPQVSKTKFFSLFRLNLTRFSFAHSGQNNWSNRVDLNAPFASATTSTCGAGCGTRAVRCGTWVRGYSLALEWHGSSVEGARAWCSAGGAWRGTSVRGAEASARWSRNWRAANGRDSGGSTSGRRAGGYRLAGAVAATSAMADGCIRASAQWHPSGPIGGSRWSRCTAVAHEGFRRFTAAAAQLRASSGGGRLAGT